MEKMAYFAVKSVCMKIVITGATKGFGRAIAEAFARPGNELLLCSRNLADLDSCKTELERQTGVTVKVKSADLSQAAATAEFAQWVLGQGVPDILVNNAGLFTPGNVHDEPEGALGNMMAVNLYSAYHLTRALVPAMIQRKSGHIFNLCSIASLKAYPGGGSYSISKFALYGFSQNLRQELMPHGIKVTHVLPGAAYTNSWSGSGVDPNRIMEAADIAKMIVAAASLSPQACVEEIILRPLAGDL